MTTASTVAPTNETAKTGRRRRANTVSESQPPVGRARIPTAGNSATNVPLSASETPNRWVMYVGIHELNTMYSE